MIVNLEQHVFPQVHEKCIWTPFDRLVVATDLEPEDILSRYAPLSFHAYETLSLMVCDGETSWLKDYYLWIEDLKRLKDVIDDPLGGIFVTYDWATSVVEAINEGYVSVSNTTGYLERGQRAPTSWLRAYPLPELPRHYMVSEGHKA